MKGVRTEEIVVGEGSVASVDPSAGRRADRESLDDFVAAHLHGLTRTAYLITGDRDRADDLVQTALLKAASSWERVHTDPLAYVRRIMHTQHISWWRYRSRRPETVTDVLPDRGRPDVESARVEPRILLADALRRLGPRQRAVLILRFYEDASVHETAEILGINPQTVKSQTRRALARLREVAPELASLVGDAEPDDPDHPDHPHDPDSPQPRVENGEPR